MGSSFRKAFRVDEECVKRVLDDLAHAMFTGKPEPVEPDLPLTLEAQRGDNEGHARGSRVFGGVFLMGDSVERRLWGKYEAELCRHGAWASSRQVNDDQVNP